MKKNKKILKIEEKKEKPVSTKESISPKDEQKVPPFTQNPLAPMRQIIILTNGTDIHVEKAEVAGKLELIAILQGVINFMNQSK